MEAMQSQIDFEVMKVEKLTPEMEQNWFPEWPAGTAIQLQNGELQEIPYPDGLKESYIQRALSARPRSSLRWGWIGLLVACAAVGGWWMYYLNRVAARRS
jgi:hypothetical protein